MEFTSYSSHKCLYSLLHSTVQQWPILVALAMLNYLLVCHLLRYARLRRLSFHRVKRIPEPEMSLSTAFRIYRDLIEREFPFTISAATTFALFKTYGIPSISSLLVHTNNLAGPPMISSKRYSDTGALLLEAVLNEPGSQRSAEAFARINYLHNRYRGSGGSSRIKDEDMLYTLSLFTLEPIKWVKRFEWREMSDVEICAVGLLWNYWGSCLNVPLHLLPGYGEEDDEQEHEEMVDDKKEGEEEVPKKRASSQKQGEGRARANPTSWLKDLQNWSEGYEKRNMVPAESNAALANSTLRIILCKVPQWMHGFGRRILATVMEGTSPRLRKAMLFDDPPSHYKRTFFIVMTLRKYFLRHLSLPRYQNLSRHPTPSPMSEGRYHLARARMHPWYIRPTFMKRWGPSALLARLEGDILPGDDKLFKPEGFLTRELGPEALTSRGREEMEEDVELIKQSTDELWLSPVPK